MAGDKYAARIDAIDGIKDPNKVPRKGQHKLKEMLGPGCMVDDQSFPDGPLICYAGQEWRCQNGSWQGPGPAC